MATITAPGIGSGLDINGLVTQLLAAEAEAPSIRLNKDEAGLQVKLSGYGSIKGSLSALQSSLSALKNPSNFQGRTISSSDTDVLTVTGNGQTGKANYDIDVTTLAETHKLSTDPTLANAQFTDVTDVLGTGTLTFKFGTNNYNSGTDTYSGFTQNPDQSTKTVTITDGSLEGVRDAINQADIGATASLVFDGEFYRLAITSDTTGEENGLQISVDDDDLDDSNESGLSLLSFDGTSTNISQTAAAVDAAFTVNGINITSASNTVTTAIESATINLNQVGSADVTVSLDKGKISSAINSFVSSYNGFVDITNQLTEYNAETQVAGTLNGDAITRGITNTVRRLISDPVGEVGEALTILAEIGVTTDSKTGRLNIDNATLNSKLESDFDRFASLFSAYGVTTDAGVSFTGSTDNTSVGDYNVNITTAASRGVLVGSSAANLTIATASNDGLALTIDGLQATVSLTAGTYTASELAAELQSKINNASTFSNSGVSVRVTESGGVFSIESQRYGSASQVEITGGTGMTDLVGGSATSTGGTDVAGTIGGVEATGSGQLLTATGNASGLILSVTGTTLGARGSVDFNRGYADRLDSYLEGILNSDGILSSTSDSIKSRIERIEEDREALNLRLISVEKRLRAQFSAMELIISQLTNTSNFLTQQLDSLPTIGSSNK